MKQPLHSLVKHNPQYHCVKIDNNIFDTFPVNGIPSDLQIINTECNPDDTKEKTVNQ